MEAVDKRTIIVASVMLVVLAAAVVNAAVFSYRWMTGSATIAGPGSASGAACVGFYSSSAQSGIDLPTAGTNYNAETYGSNTISVTPGNTVCQWTSNSQTYNLYDSISVSLPLTVGTWYIKDFYGFGYHGSSSDPTVYVWIKVETPISVSDSNIQEAKLILYDASTGSQVVVIDLTQQTQQGTTGPITLTPGSALQLDLQLTATGQTTASFTVGFYVSQQSSEGPR